MRTFCVSCANVCATDTRKIAYYIINNPQQTIIQNKGLIKILDVCLILACAYYLSFSFRTRQYDRKAKAYAEAQATVDGVVNDSVAKVKEAFFYDSIATK